MTKRLTESQPARPSSIDRGNFRLDGSWDHESPPQFRGPLYAFIRDLVRARRASKLPPSAVAEQISRSSWAKAFPNAAAWASESRWSHWPNLPASNAAEECVKRCGIGPVEESHWHAGSCLQGEDLRNLPAVPCPPEFSHALEPMLASTPAPARTRAASDSPPTPTTTSSAPVPDELWFQQHPEAIAPFTLSPQTQAAVSATAAAAVAPAPAGARRGKGVPR